MTTPLEYTIPWLNDHFNTYLEYDPIKGHYHRVFQIWTDAFENISPDEHIKLIATDQITDIYGNLLYDIWFRVSYR